MITREKVERGTPFVEAYCTGLTTAQIDFAARGWRAVRVYYKLENDSEEDFVPLTSSPRRTGRVLLSGLAHEEPYDIRVEDITGNNKIDLKLQMPRAVTMSGAGTFQFSYPVMSPAGVIYATTRKDTDPTLLRSTPNLGQTWTVEFQYSTPCNYQYYYGGKIYGTTEQSWPPQRMRLFSLDLSVFPVANRSFTVNTPADFYQPDPGGTTFVSVYPWAFEPRGPFWVLGVGGPYVYSPQNACPPERCNNRIYYSNDNWQTMSSMIVPPGGGVHTWHTRAVCWNPVSERYLITIGEFHRHNYIVTPDLQGWSLVSSGSYSNTGQPSGASIGVTWLPDGAWLAGSNDARRGQITKFWPDGRREFVKLWPPDYGGMVWDIWAFDDGEVWATLMLDASVPQYQDRTFEVVASLDWGLTWRTIYRGRSSTFHPAHIAGCHETRRIHGDWIVVDQHIGVQPRPGWAWRRLRN